MWLRNALKNWRGKRHKDADLDEEVRSYAEMLAHEKIRSGMDTTQARREAKMELGGVEQVKEQTREVRAGRFLETLWHDIRFAGRMLRKSPGFTAVAVLTLALGIGANTAIFSVVEWLTLRSLPIRNPQQMTFLAFPAHGAEFDDNFSVPEVREIRAETGDVFSGVAALMFGGSGGQGPAALSVDGKSAPIVTTYVSGNFFDLLGIKPYAGRFILPSEGHAANTDPVIVLSYRYWHKRFGDDLSVVGKPALLNGHPVTIVGIAPRGFYGLTPIMDMEAYLPLGMGSLEAGPDLMTNPKNRPIFIVAGRLRDGVSLRKANFILPVIGKRLFKKYPRESESDALHARPLKPPGIINGDNQMPKVAAFFLVLAGLVLALACLNVVNLLLVRMKARKREMGIRAALGAGRSRLVRQLLTESCLLATLGCFGGVVAGMAAARAMASTNFHTAMPVVLDFQFDWRVFLYAAGIALLSGIFVGIAPAWRVSAGKLREILQEGGRGSTAGRQRFRRSLVCAQVAGSLTLLIVAGLFVRSMMNVAHADLGFHPAGVLNVTVDPAGAGYSKAQGAAFYQELLNRARALPGVQSASITWLIPLGDDYFSSPLSIPGRQVRNAEAAPSAGFDQVSPGFFQTMGIRLLQGRDFTEADNENSTRVAIINQAMALRFWHGQSPVGREFAWADDLKHPLKIVGVVSNSRVEDLYSPYDPFFYTPLAQNYVSYVTLQVKTAGAPHTEVHAVESLIQDMAPTIPFYGVQTMRQSLDGPNGLLFFNIGAVLTGSLGLLGLILAMIGVYGVMSYSVSLRTHEIGIRMALGAQPRQILRLIGRQGILTIGIGLAVGALAAFGIAQLIRDMLVGTSSTDLLTYGTVSLLLASVSLLACYIPARRATKVDPMIALRYE